MILCGSMECTERQDCRQKKTSVCRHLMSSSGYKYCKTCALKLGVCMVCGKKIDIKTKP